MKDTAKKPILVIMAAGMGSRFGGLKQIEPLARRGSNSGLQPVRCPPRRVETVVFIINMQSKTRFKSTVGARERSG